MNTIQESRHVAGLLEWAAVRIDDPASTPVDVRLAGVAVRLAFEFHLADLCREHGPPKGQRWHNYIIRLLKAGVFTMADYKAGRRIARLAAKAVHGKPFERERAAKLLEAVSGFVS